MSTLTSRNERPAFFPAEDGTLFGILTEPATNPRGVAVIILSGGGTPLSTGVNAFSVRFCRRLASLGFHAFRFDYHGVGESLGREDPFHVATPFVADLEGAIAHIRASGSQRFVLVGSCFGARTALAAAPRVEGLIGVVLISPPIRDFQMGEREVTRLAAELSVGDLARRAVSPKVLLGLLKANRRRIYARIAREKLRANGGVSTRRDPEREARYSISQRFMEPLGALAKKETPILLIYGDADDFSGEFHRAAATPGLEILRDSSSVTSKTLLGTVHGFSDSGVADAVLDLVVDWVGDLPSADGIQLIGDATGRRDETHPDPLSELEQRSWSSRRRELPGHEAS